MGSTQFWFFLSSLLLICVVLQGAPLKEEAQKKSLDNPVTTVEGEDKDLQELLDLVHKQSRQDDVMVHREHVTHIENNNGQSVKVEQKEEKVLNTDTGEVLSDVKQQVKSTAGEATDSSDGGETEAAPHTVVETEVDLPSEGVHQTFVQEAEPNAPEEVEQESENEAQEDADLSPTDIAAYLYASQQFDAFYGAMDKLVNESKMSAEDAEAYTKAVAMEYERIQLKELEDRYTFERRSYPQQLPLNDQFGLAPGYDLYPQPVGVAEPSEPSFDMLAYVNSLAGPEDQEYLTQKQDQSDLLLPETIDPYQFVAALWNEAYENGNQEAQEIVRLLYDRVSHDSNPDDMGEIRDILLDTVAQSLDDTPYTFDTPIALPQLPLNREGAEPSQEEAGPINQEAENEANEETAQEETSENAGEGESEVGEEEEEEDLSAIAASNNAEGDGKEIETQGEEQEAEEAGQSEVDQESNDEAGQKH